MLTESAARTPSVLTATCRRCGRHIWHIADDPLWLCNADTSPYCPGGPPDAAAFHAAALEYAAAA